MQPSQFKDLNYILLPGRPDGHFAHMDLYDQAFQFWESFWSKTLEEIGLDRRKLSADDFLRQDIIAVLRHEEDIVGMHLYTFFPLNAVATPNHSYFRRFYNEEFIRTLNARNVRSLMSMEYFSVHKDWRARQVGASLGMTIGSLGCRVGLSHEVDAMIGSARADVPAAAMAYEIGATPVVQNLIVNERPTDLIAFFPENVINPKDRTVKELIDRLWANRWDLRTHVNTGVDKLKSVA